MTNYKNYPTVLISYDRGSVVWFVWYWYPSHDLSYTNHGGDTHRQVANFLCQVVTFSSFCLFDCHKHKRYEQKLLLKQLLRNTQHISRFCGLKRWVICFNFISKASKQCVSLFLTLGRSNVFDVSILFRVCTTASLFVLDMERSLPLIFNFKSGGLFPAYQNWYLFENN